MRHPGVAALTLLLPFAAYAVEADFHWTGTLPPGQALEIKGVNGSIRAELANGATIEVSARKTANHSDPSSVRVEVVPFSGGVTICSVYPDGDSNHPNVCAPGNEGRISSRDHDVNVEYTVRVPAGIRFVPKTVNGSITATGLRSDIEASTVNGKVKLDTSGIAQATTVNGSIDASLGTVMSNPLKFSTVNGSIHLAVPSATSADVDASTVTGSIATEFPLTVSGRFGPKNIKGRIGNGGPSLRLSTVNGAIELSQGGGRVL
jgi:Putative adhesin